MTSAGAAAGGGSRVAEAAQPKRVVGTRVPRAGPLGALFVATILGYGIWAAFTGHGAFSSLRVGYGPDSVLYLRAARSPVWSTEFLATPDGGPFLFLLLAKLCLRNLRAIVLVQSLLAAAAWLFLSDTVGTLLHEPWVRSSGFVAVLLIALSPSVLLWNATIATESLAISLLVIGIALWLRVATGAGRGAFVALLLVLVALACTRDTNEMLLLVIALFAGVVAVGRPSLRRRALAMVAVCVVAAGVNIGLATKAHRWYHPLNETIAVRILGSTMATDYFVAHGMPYDAPVRALHEPYANLGAVDVAPQYAPFRAWVRNRGRSTYARFLLSHPGWDIGKPFADRRRLLAPHLPYGVLYHDEPRGVFRVIGAIAFPGNIVLVEVWTGTALIAATVLWRRRDRRPTLTAVGVAAVLVVPAFLAAWHGDAREADRHSLSAAVQLRIVLWIITLVALDVIATQFRGHGRARLPHEEASCPTAARA